MRIHDESKGNLLELVQGDAPNMEFKVAKGRYRLGRGEVGIVAKLTTTVYRAHR